MRLRRLDLLRYGHFTDRSIELPPGGADLHVVFGPNEAGKSTALCAMEDLLFGIPMRSPYDFLHGYSEMRVGARIENAEASLEVVRRKGRKDTLLGARGLPAAGGEGALEPFLAGADRHFFQRMFSLDRARLEEGGREILEAKDEIGEIIFSAGTGTAGLRDRLARLGEEADALWARRRASHREYYRAADKLKEAEGDLRQQTLSADKWRERKRAFEAAQDACTEIEARFEEVSAQGRRIGRIRRVYRHVRRKADLDGRIEALGQVAVLPEDAGQVLDRSRNRESEASARIDTLSGQLDAARKELEGLTYDEGLVLRADDVRQLHERRIETRREKADLPKRRAELDAAERELRDLAAELGWRTDEAGTLIDRIPERPRVATVRSLLGRRGELSSEVSKSTESLEEARAERARLQDRLDASGDAADVARLDAVIRTVREGGDLAGRLEAATRGVKDARERVERLLRSLHPGVPNDEDAAAMRVPARTEVQRHRDLVQDCERRTREIRQKIRAAGRDFARARKAYESAVRDGDVVPLDTLQAARIERDALWERVKLGYVDNTPTPVEKDHDGAGGQSDLPETFEQAMRSADALADRRFDHAEAAAHLAERSRAVAGIEDDLAELRAQEETLVQEAGRLGSEWPAMWTGAPFEPHAPDAMLEWLDKRRDLVEAIERRVEAESVLELRIGEVRRARDGLLAELAALAVDRATLENDPLPVVLEHADRIRQEHRHKAESKARLQEESREAEAGVERRGRALARAREAWAQWQGRWSAALSALGLVADLPPDTVAARIDVIDQMRERAVRIKELRHQRIEKINRDVADFESAVAEFVRERAGDLAGVSAEEAVLEIEKRLEEAERIRDLLARKRKEADAIEKQIAGVEENRRQARGSVMHLEDAAGAGTMDALEQAIERSDTCRALRQELAVTLDLLEQEGDGLSVDRLIEECAGVDIDRLAAQEETNAGELDDLRRRSAAAAEAGSQAREAFEATGGDDAAARAEAVRQEALAEMRRIAGRYVRVRTSAMLLQWAIDRYRQEKQAPLLQRAGRLFETLTGGAFATLEVDYDDRDRAHLVGRRPDRQAVPVSGMSTGTADQLFLALRIASVEDYLDRADALPFVADDLFVNFDDDRAGAGFEVLGALARRTQVLFFTHHRHLVEVARRALGGSLPVVDLSAA